MLTNYNNFVLSSSCTTTYGNPGPNKYPLHENDMKCWQIILQIQLNQNFFSCRVSIKKLQQTHQQQQQQ